MTRGILFGCIASVLWALSYFLPLMLPGFSPVEVTCGRYFFFGLISALFWAFGDLSLSQVPRWILVRSVQFALTAYFGFYILHVAAIQTIGAGFTALIIAFLPVSIAIYGNSIHKEFPFSILVHPLLLMSIGLVSIHFTELSFDSDATTTEMVMGVSGLLFAVAMWTWYASESRKIMKSQEIVGAVQLANLIGVVCLPGSLLIYGAAAWLWPEDQRLLASDLLTSEIVSFVWISLFMGIFVSWVSGVFWQRAVKLLPVSLAGQVLVVEILLALVYIYLYEWRAPTPWELFGTGLVIGGIALSLVRISRHSD